MSGAGPTWADMEKPIEDLLDAYSKLFAKSVTAGVRRSAPLQQEIAAIRVVLNDIRVGSYQGRATTQTPAP